MERRELEAAFPDKVLVFGEGRPDAKIVMIGEAPGEKEEQQRRPFVGKAGENLNEFLRLSGIRREEIYITNTVKFRPTQTGKSGKSVNRKPTRAEIDAFLPFLLQEIEEISPECIVTLGNVPLNALLGSNVRIGEVHGRFLNTDKFTVYPMYHPASVIYNRSLMQTYLEDIREFGQWMRSGS